jgi:hypothetical protein
MAFEQRHADFGIALEAADAGTMPGARVDHDHRCGALAHVLLECVGAAARDAQQPVVRRRIEIPSVRHRLGLEVQQGRHARGLVRAHVGRTFAQRVRRRSGAPQRVQPVAGEQRDRA